MFKKSRSKRANQIAHAPQAPPTSAAAIAAVQAAGAQSIQDGRLAAGAAAAALRSHTSSPVNVGNVQTRRTLRRASLTSDVSTSSFQQGRPTLSRQNSSSSMTSRTFRSPSPHGRKPSNDAITPPIPPIPRSGATSPSSMLARSFRRPASTEPSARVTSPTPHNGLRNMSVDTATRKISRPVAIDTNNLDDLAERNGSRNSINFSRPMSPENRTTSPLPRSPTSPSAQARMGYMDASGYQYQEIASKPVHKKSGLGGDEGSHLAAATMGNRPRGTSLDGSPATGRPRRMPLPRRISEEPEEDEFEEIFDPHTRTMVKRRKPGKRPKFVASPPRVASPTVTSPSRGQLQRTMASSAPSNESSPKQTPPKTTAASVAPRLPPETKAREISVSPARKARFSLRPEENASLHEPGRSLTPTKSALRKSPSPRGLSPADSTSKRASWNQPGFAPSETSETSYLSDDRPKRRSVRVSFDDQPTIVGTSSTTSTGLDSPTIMSPQHEKKKNWFGLRKKQPANEETDEGMAPTPALPSFGSVRGRRPTEDEMKEPTGGVLGIPGVAVTTGEQTPSEAGSHVDETEAKERAVPAPSQEELQTAHNNGSVVKLKSGDVPVIAVIPGTPAADKIEDPLDGAEATKASPSPVEGSNPAALGIAEPEPEEAAAEDDPAIPSVGHVAEAIHQQTEQTDPSEERPSTDSQESHYSDASEGNDDDGDGNDGDGFGSINAIVGSPVAKTDSSKKKLAESVPPLTGGSPSAEIKAVDAAEADQGAEPTTFGDAGAAAVASSPADPADKPEAKNEDNPLSGDSPASASPSSIGQKSPVESVSYNPRRMDSNSSKHDDDFGTPKRFAENRRSTLADKRLGGEVEPERTHAVAQSGPYPTFEKSPRQSFQDVQRATSASPIAAETTAGPLKDKASTSAVTRATPEKKPLKSALKQTNRVSTSTDLASAAAASAQPRGTLHKKGHQAAGQASGPSNDAVALAQAMVKVKENHAREAKEREADLQATLQRARASSLGGSSAPVSKRSSMVPAMPKLRRRGSDDSDSSFKRGPPSVTSEGGRVSMRRSMRSNASARPQSMMSSASVRGTMRENPSQRSRPTSMMGGGGAGVRTMRQQREPSPTRSLLSFRKGSRSSSMQASGPRKRLTSRFDNDSDDDDVPLPALSSRFDDSDDEDQPRNLRPVRGIPHRTEEVDSSDLDSDGEIPAPFRNPAKPMTEQERIMELARQRLGIEARPDVPLPEPEPQRTYSQGDLVEAFAEKKRDKQSKRRSIFASLSRRKTQSKVAKDTDESIARKDTHLERTKLRRTNTGQASLTSTPERPNAIRQSTAERIATLRNQVDPNSWPLPESPSVERRPDTSDGSPPTTVLERPTPIRQISTETAPVYGRSGKKKRFPLLRRAFGLHD